MDQLKLHNEIISGPEICRRYDGLDYDDTYTALIDSGAGVLDADQCLRAFQVEIVRVLRGVIQRRVVSADTVDTRTGGVCARRRHTNRRVSRKAH